MNVRTSICFRLFVCSDPNSQIIQIIEDSMVKSVKCMRIFSICTTIISTIYLSLLLIFHQYDNKDTLHILTLYPSFYCVSSFMFSLNFARNREAIMFKFYTFKQCCLKMKSHRNIQKNLTQTVENNQLQPSSNGINNEKDNRIGLLGEDVPTTNLIEYTSSYC